jgi:UDP-N-acetylglucosamine 2-epimerase (non-hydrolysing)
MHKATPQKWISVVGARPNFIKIAPFSRAVARHNEQVQHGGAGVPLEHLLVHTGQHYDDRMSQTFFTDLNIAPADRDLGIGSGSHAQQVGKTMIAFEAVCEQVRPDLVIVVGDVNATLACSVTAKKLGIRIAHLEAGLRSRDKTMPEEINRLVTDSISDILLAPDRFSVANLQNEGHVGEDIHFVGNIMIDTLERELPKAKAMSLTDVLASAAPNADQGSFNLISIPERYVVVTLHRPSNVDNPRRLAAIVTKILKQAESGKVFIWPLHPRTRKCLADAELLSRLELAPNVILTEPLGYHALLRLNLGAQALLTDSGGLQEECCVLGTPCITLRDNTERPVTLRKYGGTNVLVGMDTLTQELDVAFNCPRRPYKPKLWDGHAAERVLAALLRCPRTGQFQG